MRIEPATTPGAGLREKRDRLAREIAELESKAARLRASAEARRKTLNRLDARLVLEDGATRHAHG